MWKILHTSDWHLGKKLGRFSRIEEQETFLNELNAIIQAEKVDLLLIAGDLFDTYNPSVQAQQLCYSSLVEVSDYGKIPVLIIAGNHDSPWQLEMVQPLAQANSLFFVGRDWEKYVTFQKKFKNGVGLTFENNVWKFEKEGEQPICIVATPFLNQYRWDKFIDFSAEEGKLQEALLNYWHFLYKSLPEKSHKILLTHFFVLPTDGKKWEEPEGEKSILQVGGLGQFQASLLPPFDYIALGHLHRFQSFMTNTSVFTYSGSPLAYSFSESNQKKYCVFLNFSDTELKTEKYEIKAGKKLFSYYAKNFSEAINWLADNQTAWVELSVETEKGFSRAELQNLYQTHTGIVNLYPIILNEMQEEEIEITGRENEITLFKKFFKEKTGREAAEEEISLFEEILNLDLQEAEAE
jgi:exonuclease SbcD